MRRFLLTFNDGEEFVIEANDIRDSIQKYVRDAKRFVKREESDIIQVTETKMRVINKD